MVKGEGGLVAYLGTNNAYDVEKMVDAGNAEAELIYHAMAYQVAKYIGEMYTVLKCEVDAILITGGIALKLIRKFNAKTITFHKRHDCLCKCLAL